MVAAAVAHADLVLLDLKHMDAEKHKRYTGVDNQMILANARQLARTMVARGRSGGRTPEREHTGMWIRIPVIPTINDDEANMRATARFVREELRGAVRAVELLGYHQLGGAKRQRLGQELSLQEIHPPTRAHLDELRALWERELDGQEIQLRAR